MLIRKIQPAGLTILELLVTVMVLTLLTGLLMPAVLEARSMARRTACQSNLRQWGLAVQMYADTHDGRLPYRGQGIQPTERLDRIDDWFNALPPFVESPSYFDLRSRLAQPQVGDGSVWVCPEAEPLDPHPHRDELKPFFAYGMNMALSAPKNGRPDHLERVGPQQTMVFMADGLGPYCSVFPSQEDYSPLARHTGAVNIAFLDGRVAAYAGAEVGCGIGDPERPDVRWFPPNTTWPGPPK